MPQLLSLDDVASVLPGGAHPTLPAAHTVAPAPAAQTQTASTGAGKGLTLDDVAQVMPDESSAKKGLTLDDVASVVPEETAPKQHTPESVRAASDEDLAKDKSFHPVEFYKEHEAQISKDPALLDKVVRQYRQQETKGTTLGEKAEAVKEGAIPALKNLVVGGAKGLARVLSIDPHIGVPARLAKGVIQGDVQGAMRDLTAAQVEAAASVESSTLGAKDLLARGARSVAEGFQGLPLPVKAAVAPIATGVLTAAGVKPKAEQSDEEFKQRFLSDVKASKLSDASAKGNGPVLSAIGANADKLAEAGIKLDPQAIEEMGVVTNPINFIPLGAAVGAVSKVGGHIVTHAIAATGTAEVAAKLAANLNAARDLAAGIAGGAAKHVGNAIEATGNAVGRVTEPLAGPAALGGLLTHGLSHGVGAGALAKLGPKAIKAAGRGIRAGGETLAGEAEAPAVLQAGASALAGGAKAAAEATALTVPFDIGARPEEEPGILGSIGAAAALGGATHGIATGASIAGHAAQEGLAKHIFETVQQGAPSADAAAPYRTDPTLDRYHAETLAKLDPATQHFIDFNRGILRPAGVEIYALPPDQFAQRTGSRSALGYETRTDGGKVQILLNSGAEALPHEFFHAIEDVLPEQANALKAEVKKNLTTAQLKQFGDYYNSRLNGGKPEWAWTHKPLTPDQVASEASAEVFSRLMLSQDLSGVAAPVRKSAALFASQFLEKLGIPLGGVGMDRNAPGVSTLGVRPGADLTAFGREWLKTAVDKLQEGKPGYAPAEPPPLPGSPETPAPAAPVLPQGENAAPSENTPAPTPSAPRPVLPAPEGEASPNTRVSRETQNQLRTAPAGNGQEFSAERAADLGIDKAVAAAEKTGDKNTISRVDEINGHVAAGNPVLEVDYNAVTSASTPENPLGRSDRRAEQAAAYVAENTDDVPENVRSQYQKVFAFNRWEVVKGKPQVLAMSADKVLANISKISREAAARGVSDLIPYEKDRAGRLTENGYQAAMRDLQDYAANQANGYRGDGERLVRPTEAVKASIPAENPNYTPVKRSADVANFQNLVQGLHTPETARSQKNVVPGNIKAQEIARVNNRPTETPASIQPEHIKKQEFKDYPGRTVQEVNPLRNALAEAGVPTRDLIEVTERLSTEQINSVKARPDLNFKAPVTDTIRGGFLPNPLAEGETVKEFGEKLLGLHGDGWRNATQGMQGGLTGGAWALGSHLRDAAELGELQRLESAAKKGFEALASDGKFDEAMAQATKAQFFREAFEAATNTGSAKAARASGFLKDPAPLEKAAGKFLPKTEKDVLENVSRRAETARIRETGKEISVEDFKRKGSASEQPEQTGDRAAMENFLPADNFDNEVDPIVSAAIRTPSGHIETGAFHGAALMNLAESYARGEVKDKLPPGIKSLSDFLEDEQSGDTRTGFIEDGFVTKSGKFLNRAQALDHAERIGQMKKENLGMLGYKHGVLESNEFAKGRSFLPAAEAGVESKAPSEVAKAKKAWAVKGIESPYFKRWFKGSKVVDENGSPMALYHGTTHDFTEFTKDRAQVENDFGKGFYFTNERFDAGDNYAGRGPDLTVRMERLADTKYGDLPHEEAMEKAAQELEGPNAKTISAYVRLENPAILGGEKETVFDHDYKYADPEDPESDIVGYEGNYQEFVHALKMEAHEFDNTNSDDIDQIMNGLVDAGDRIKLSDAVEKAKSAVSYAEDRDGSLAGNEIIRAALERMGFDGIIDNTVAKKFPNMPNMHGSVTHVIAFRPEQVKAVEGVEGIQGTFDRKNPDMRFLPAADDEITPELRAQRTKEVRAYRKQVRENYPEAIVPEFSTDDEGNVKLGKGGVPLWKKIPYRFDETPVAEAAAKGIRDPAKRQDAAETAVADNLVEQAQEAIKNPEIKAGIDWYNLAREKIGRLLGDDGGFFTELLGATSAQTPVPDNFKQSVEAYNKFKAGDYDELIKKYREGKQRWDDGDIQDYLDANPDEPDPERHQYLNWWIDTHDLKPRKANGQLYNANSKQVLKVFDGSWKQEVGGPKTPNFADNLSGKSDEATIDIWAARALMRAGNKGNDKRWRFVNASETGVADKQFNIGQSIFRKAAAKLGMKPHELQALLWFNEKHLWAEKGWTSVIGEEKSDFNTLLDRTKKSETGLLDFTPEEITAKHKSQKAKKSLDETILAVDASAL